MKKNIVQDVIPPKRTIRNVELLHKPKRAETIPAEIIEPKTPVRKPPVYMPPSPPPPVDDFSYKYEYDEPPKRSKKILYVSIALLAIVLAFGISAFFKSAKIVITPKNEIHTFDENFSALKDISTNDLSFQIVTTAKDVEKTIVATDEQIVQKKATGTIVVYNNYSTQSQALVKTTRFATPEGLIFRTTKDIVIPGIQVKNGNTVAGSAEVLVEADKAGAEYNIPLKDFTIVGFKGTPKYTKIYGRSKTVMSGGFSGTQKTVSQDTMNSADKELENILKISLSKDIISQIPENFILYPDSISYSLDPTVQADNSSNQSTTTDKAILKKHGSVSAVIFDKGALSRAIVAKILPDAINDVIKITNLDNLSFAFATDSLFDSNTSTSLNFNLKGDANFVWVFDESKLKTDLLGMSKKNAVAIISTYKNINEAEIQTSPFWNQTIPQDPKKVTLINKLAN